MNHVYDAFDVLPDGTLIWRAAVEGHQHTIDELWKVAKGSAYEFRLKHIPSKTVIATINAKAD